MPNSMRAVSITMAALTAMDDQVGRLRDKLRALGIEKKTLLIFCSDNGPADPLARKKIATAGPFKGHKHTMYEGGLLVPACMEWPGVIPAGGETKMRCSTVDIFPTVAAATGFQFKNNEKRPIDGLDLMTVVRGEVTEREQPLFFRLSASASGNRRQGHHQRRLQASAGGHQGREGAPPSLSYQRGSL